MSAEELEGYEADLQLELYREYRDVARMFTFIVETERRFYLANDVDLTVRGEGDGVYAEVVLTDAWVWDMHRPSRFLEHVRVVSFGDVNVERIAEVADPPLLD